MLENSGLSDKRIIVKDQDVFKFLPAARHNQKVLFQMKQRLAWPQKMEDEQNKVLQLFTPDIANFIIHSPDVRFSFDRDDVSDKQILTTNNHVKQVIKGPDTLVQVYSTSHLLSGNSKLNVDDALRQLRDEKLELLLARRTTGDKLVYPRRQDKIEPDRILVGIGKKITSKSGSLRLFEKTLRATYGEQIKKTATLAETGGYYGSSTNARIGGLSSSTVNSALKLRK